MTVVCAWCGLMMRRAGSEVSHGICSPCSTKVESRFITNWPPLATGPRRRRPPMAPSHPLPGFLPEEAVGVEAS